ncbi:autotransporter domain-containing protein [Lysobacter enzymogenes]|uniref:autotransporter domain-containing protein n=1 Tax=Lysobacter enzymogenes TaxID=69 RepID=UPI001A97113F|nr:autotransporter serine protease [Lysobacter enzymogenes]QQP96917.1 autotransporter domain-containing protein [Lysobacter enzymogenes]
MPRVPNRKRPSSARPRRRSLAPLSVAILSALLAVPGLSAAQTTSGLPGDADSWRSEEFERDWGLGAINAHYAYARGLTGAGVAIGQYDTGVGLDHPEFAGRGHVALTLAEPGCSVDPSLAVMRGPGRCFATRGDVPIIGTEYVYPFNGANYNYTEYGNHGTHVAGTMVAQRDGQGMHGVAFGSRLVTARFFGDTVYRWDQDSSGKWQHNYIAGSAYGSEKPIIDDLYAQMGANGVRAVNIEIWLPVKAGEANTRAAIEREYRSGQDYYDAYMNGAIAHGIVNVVALGNDSGNIANIYPGMPTFRPEAQPYWLSVANVARNDDGSYAIAPSSSICAYSKDWCVSAPGTDIYSAKIGGRVKTTMQGTLDGDDPLAILLDRSKPQWSYENLTGTSMAAPHAIGALSLLFERYPYLNGPQVRDVLLTTATDLGAPGVDEIYGWGLIDLRKAIDGPGQIRVDTDVVMDRAAGGAKVWDGPAWDDWRNDIGGPGVLTKSGAGWLRLSGNNAFGGLRVAGGVMELTGRNAYAAQVDGGALVVNGTLDSAQLPVHAGGVLAGSGRIVGDVRMEGTLSPGNSIGTLSVQGDYTQAAGSTYVAEVAADGRADRIDVAGKALLQGGTVQVLYAPGRYVLGQNFNLLNAAGGVSGRFAGVDQGALSPFLQFGLSYAANAVALDVVRGASLASAATTPNQRAAAAAADALAVGQGLPQVLTQLFPAQAPAALDALSGEGHASLRSIAVDDSRHVRDAALARARSGRGGFAADGDGASQGAWVQALKSGGTLDGDGNAARNEYNGSATLVGYDYRFANGWRIGALGGGGRIDNNNDRLDKGRIKSIQIGVYAGQNWGRFGLSAGYTQASQDLTLERRIGFDGFADRTRAAYDGKTRQGFVEGAYRFGGAAWGVEPYLQFAQVRVKTDAFQETGGAAALSGRSAQSKVDVSTLGVRFNLDLKGSQQDQSWLSLRGGLGRRHASGDLTPVAQVAWRGGAAFDTAGAPLADDATVLEAGVAARLSANGLLELNYSGQFGDEADDHGVNARYSLRF